MLLTFNLTPCISSRSEAFYETDKKKGMAEDLQAISWVQFALDFAQQCCTSLHMTRMSLRPFTSAVSPYKAIRGVVKQSSGLG